MPPITRPVCGGGRTAAARSRRTTGHSTPGERDFNGASRPDTYNNPYRWPLYVCKKGDGHGDDVRMDEQERAWLDAYRKGDTQALGKLVEYYRRPLFAFILKMTEGRGDAEEVFQEVWIRAIRNLGGFQEKNLLGWLFRIAHNLIIDQARRNRLVVHPSSAGSSRGEVRTDWMQSIPASERGPASETAGRDLGVRIQEAMGCLPPEQLEVFLLRMEGDVPFKEIARIQGVSINTALARMHYAVLKMREELKNEYAAFFGE